MLAKHQYACRALEELFRSRKVSKRYLAIVDGVPRETSGDVTIRLQRTLQGSGRQAVMTKSRQGLPAQTAWTRLQIGVDWALLECFPKTGRTHQIRVHLQSIGHPILGDYHYARETMRSILRPRRVLLHAADIAFAHPVSGIHLCVSAPLPHDMKNVLEVRRLVIWK